MANKSNMNSMRRKVIEDSAPQKKNEKQADEQLGALTGISNKIDDVQATAELTADVIETKSNEIIQNLEDVQAGIELTVDSSEKTNDALSRLNDTASLMDEKLAKLADLLTAKHDPTTDVSVIPPTVETIGDNIPDTDETPTPEDLLSRLIPPVPNNNPDADFFPPAETPPTDEEKKEEDEKKKKFFGIKFDQLIKGVKGGFNKTISLTDKISSMLFSYTVSALAGMAKTALMVMSVIMLIDLIKIHFDYWSNLFESSFKEFNIQAEKWGPLLESIINMTDEIITTFKNGDWSGLTKAIVVGLIDVMQNLGEMILLGMGKLLAGIMRAMDFKDTGDNIEGAALDRFQNQTGAQLSEEESLMKAKFIDKRERATDTAPKGMKDVTAGVRLVEGKITKEEYDRLMAGGQSQDGYSDKSDEERIKLIADRENAKAELKRTTEYVKKTDPTNATRLNSANEAVDSTKAHYDELAKNSPEMAKSLEADMQQLIALMKDKKNKPVAEPLPAKEQPEVKQSDNIKLSADAKEARTKQGGEQQAPMQVNTSVNKNSTNVYKMPPQTSSAAPGMQGTMKTN